MVFVRGAALALNGPEFLVAAAYTLVVVLVMQTVIMGAWFVAFDRPETGPVPAARMASSDAGRRCPASQVRSAGLRRSHLQNAAYVRAVGQIELLFTFIASVFFFNEQVRRSEVVGIGLIVMAILMIVLAG